MEGNFCNIVGKLLMTNIQSGGGFQMLNNANYNTRPSLLDKFLLLFRPEIKVYDSGWCFTYKILNDKIHAVKMEKSK